MRAARPGPLARQSRETALREDALRGVEGGPREAKGRDAGVKVTLILDLLHVLHYVWKAAHAIFGADKDGACVWVGRYAEGLLTRPTDNVVAGMRGSAKHRGLSASAQKIVDRCTTYLSERT